MVIENALSSIRELSSIRAPTDLGGGKLNAAAPEPGPPDSYTDGRSVLLKIGVGGRGAGLGLSPPESAARARRGAVCAGFFFPCFCPLPVSLRAFLVSLARGRGRRE